MPTLKELESALLRAEAANDTAAARAIAQDMRSMMGASISANAPPLEVPPPSMLEQAREMLDIPDIVRGAGITTRGALPPAIGAIAGIPGGPAGVLAGSLAVPAAEFLVQGANLMLPEQYQIPSPALAVEGLLTEAGFPVPETTRERMIQAGGGALTGAGTQLPALAKLTGSAVSPVTREVANTLAQIPGRQLAASAPSAMTGQATTELTGSPTLGLLAEVATGAPFGMGYRQSNAPSAVELSNITKDAYRRAKEAGVAFAPEAFSSRMSSIAADLRKEGYRPGAYPKIDSALAELTDPNAPKDFTELTTLRKFIRNAQASTDNTERRIASMLKDEFDDYVASAPTTDVIGSGTKGGVSAWEQARRAYSKEMKAEIFEDMLTKAELDKTKFVQAGPENSMAQELRKLASNPKKMRLFSKAEQEEIRKAAKGTKTQNLLKFFGRFAPTGPVSAIPMGGMTLYDPTIGAPLALGAMGARAGATALRQQSLERLADTMRMGGPVTESAMFPAITAGRGLLSPYVPPQ